MNYNIRMTVFYAIFCVVCALICVATATATVYSLIAAYGTAEGGLSARVKKTKVYSLTRRFDAFTDSYGFLFCLSLFVTTGWLIGHYLPGLIVLSTLFCFITLTRRDIKPVFPMLITAVMLLKDLSVTFKPAFYITVIPALIALIAHFIIYPPKRFYFGKLFAPLILVSVSLFSGGLLSPYLHDYLRGIGEIVAVGAVMLAFYIFFSNGIEEDGEGKLIPYVCASVVFAGMAACLQLLTRSIYIWTNGIKTSIESVQVGWSHFNGLGALFLIVLPICFYLLTKTKRKWIYYALIMFFYAGIALSESDGSMAVALCFTPFMLVITAKNMRGKDRRGFLFVSAAMLAAVIAGLLIVPGAVDYFAAKATASLYNDSGRTALYEEGVTLFLKYPIFGVGAGYYNDATMNTIYFKAFNFHSTAINVAATMGILGIISYVVYFVQRFRIYADRKVPQASFIFLAFLAFESYAMVDTGEFKAMPLLLILTLFACAMEKTKIKGGINPPLTCHFKDI